MSEPAAFFVAEGDGTFASTPATAGPWGPDTQHGGPPAALLVRAFEVTETQPRSRIAEYVRTSRPYKAVMHLIPKPLRSFTRRLNERRTERAEVDFAEFTDYLRPLQQQETQELGDLFHRDFRVWKTLYGA